MTDKIAVIGIGDTHINSTVALCPPTINLDDGGTYRSSKGQRWLWRTWLKFWEQVDHYTEGYRRVVVLNGDLGELDTKRRSNQIITANKATILEMALHTLEPMLEVADNVIVIRGTLAHTGKSSWLEEAIAQDLDNVIQPNGMSSWWHYRGKAANVRFDIAHHASMGRLPWTEKYAAVKIANIARIRYKADMDEKPPDVVWRSHNHRYADSGGNFDDVFAVCLPAWSLATEFVYRVSQENSVADIGGVVELCEDGEHVYKDFRYRPPKSRRVWTNKM